MLSLKKMLIYLLGMITLVPFATVNSLAAEPSLANQSNSAFEKFEIESGVLKNYKGKNEKTVKIPEGVFEIDFGAFQGNKEIEKIIFPESLKIINGYAFDECSGLQHIKLPDSLEKIGPMAFVDCKNLKLISFGENFNSLGEMVFYGCDSLQKIKVHKKNKIFADYHGLLYSKDLTKLILCPVGIVGVPNLPKTLKEIGDNAFFRCNKIESIHFNDNLLKIHEAAFYGCESLKSLTLGGNIKRIGAGAFMQCIKLESVVIGEKVRSVGNSAFAECPNLKVLIVYSPETKIGHKMDFPKSNFKIMCRKDSLAESYANKRKIAFEIF